jgi:hypothetical protein
MNFPGSFLTGKSVRRFPIGPQTSPNRGVKVSVTLSFRYKIGHG